MGSLSRSRSKAIIPVASFDQPPGTVADPVAKAATPTSKAETRAKSRRRPKTSTVSWYGSLLIISTLLVAAGWELFRLILAIVVLD